MTSKKIKIKPLETILKKFNMSILNNMTLDDKLELIVDLSNSISSQLKIKPITKDNIFLVTKNELANSAAEYMPNKSGIRINEEILTKTHNDNIDIYSLLGNIIHETIHYIQDIENKYNTLYLPIKTRPYYILQPHEQDAYNSEIDILKRAQHLFDPVFSILLNLIENNKKNMENIAIQDLKSRNYATDKFSIQKQINQILPFYKNYHNFLEFEKNENIEKSIINNGNTQITIIKDNDSWHCDIAINKKGEINHLYCCINDTCKISEIHKSTNNDDLPVPSNEKEELMIILNKIIDIYNERHIDKCSKIEIMPISLFDDKKDYEQFLKQKHVITKPIEDLTSGLISLNEIKKQCLFDTLDEQVKTNTAKKEKQDKDQLNKDDLNR